MKKEGWSKGTYLGTNYARLSVLMIESLLVLLTEFNHFTSHFCNNLAKPKLEKEEAVQCIEEVGAICVSSDLAS